MRFGLENRTVIIALLALLCSMPGWLGAAGQWAAPQPVSAFAIPTAQLIQPDELNRILHARDSEKPLILQVGSHVMYAQAHIPGAEYVGPGSQADGVAQLRGRIASLPRKTFIVIYCGCCPWDRCPNVGPAYQLLHDMGFARAKVLYLADNFGADWANKGYPVESGR
jgi:3-mercaptopyruvate sulfurtransferase SseA